MKVIRKYKVPKHNPNLGGANSWAGWCHAAVREGFGIPAAVGYGSATQAWEKAERRHKNRTFPKAAVPLFFKLAGEPSGHVVVRLTNGKVVTTGLNSTHMTFSSLEALLKRWPSLTYLGWTEDLNGYDIITGYSANPPKPSKPSKGVKVKTYHKEDKDARAKGRTVKPETHIYLNTKSGGAANAVNIVGGKGPYSITSHVYAEGKPGDILTVQLIWQNAKTRKNSAHYSEQLEFDSTGKIKASREFKRAVSSGWRVFLRASAPASNKGSVNVSLLDSDAYLYI